MGGWVGGLTCFERGGACFLARIDIDSGHVLEHVGAAFQVDQARVLRFLNLGGWVGGWVSGVG